MSTPETSRWAGVTATAKEVHVFIADVEDGAVPRQVAANKLKVGTGPKPDRYNDLHATFRDYLRGNSVDRVILQASAGGQMAAKQAILDAAEVRGILMVAARAAEVDVQLIKKGVISRTFGERNVDEYLKDDTFFATEVDSNGQKLLKGLRDAAFLVVVARS